MHPVDRKKYGLYAETKEARRLLEGTVNMEEIGKTHIYWILEYIALAK